MSPPEDRAGPARRRPHPLARGALAGLLRADPRGIVGWAAGALITQDWGAPSPSWERSLVVLDACASDDLGLIVVRAPDGVFLLRSLAGEPQPGWPTLAASPLAVAPDGARVASVAPDGALELRAPGRSPRRLEVPSPPRALAFAPDGAWLACVGGRDERAEGWLMLVDLRSGQPAEAPLILPTARPATRLATAPDRLALAAGRQVQLVRADGTALGSLDEQPGDVTALALRDDLVAVGYRAGPVALWSFPTDGGRGAYRTAVEGHHGAVRAARFVADGAGLVTVSDDQTVALWEPPTVAARCQVVLGSSPLEALAVAPPQGASRAGRRLAVAREDGRASVLDARTGRVLLEVGQHARGAFAVAWSIEGGLLASGGADGRVRLWGAQRGDLRAEAAGVGQIQGLAFEADGALLVADDRGLGRWPRPLAALVPAIARLSLRLPRPPPIARLLDAGPCHAVVVGAGRLAAACADGRVHLHGKEGWSIVQAHPAHAWSLAFSSVDAVLACGGDGGSVALIDARFGEVLLRVTVPGGRVWSLDFSPDGRLLAVGGEDGAVRLLELATGRVEDTLPGHGRAVTAVRWEESGLISGARDGSLLRWSRDDD